MLDTHKLFEAAADHTSYLSAVGLLPNAIDRETVLVEDFLLYREGRLTIYYAPFDHINETARVILLGVTPGWTQMKLAFETVRDAVAMTRIRWRGL